MKMTCLAFPLFILLLTSTALAAPAGQWTTYTWNYSIKDMVRDGDDHWVATGGGLYLLDAGDLSVKEKYTTAEGLAGNNVTRIAVDDDHNIWIGDEQVGGFPSVSSFDGKTFTHYDFGDTGIQYVSSLVKDSWGNIWAGRTQATSCGDPSSVSYYNGSDWVHFDKRDSFYDFTRVREIVIHNNDVWLLTYQSIYRYIQNEDTNSYSWEQCCVHNHTTNWTSYQHIETTPDNRLLVQTSCNGRDHNIIELDKKTWAACDSIFIATDHDIDTIFDFRCNSKGTLWIASRSRLVEFDGEKAIIHNEYSSLFSGNIKSLYMDTDDSIWIGTVDGDIARYTDGIWKTGKLSYESVMAQIYSVLPLSRDIFWISTRDAMIKVVNGEMTIFNIPNDDYHNQPGERRMISDSHGRIWTNGKQSLYCVDGNHVDSVHVKYLTPGKHIRNIYPGSNNDIWITGAGQVLRYHNNTIVNYTETFNIPYVPYMSFLEHNGILWLARDQIVRFHNGETTVFDTYDVSGTEENTFEDLEIDSRGNVWTVTKDAILCKFDGQSWTQIPAMHGKYSSRIREIAIDNDDNIWTNTYLDGVFQYNRDEWTIFTIKDGLIALNISEIKPAEDGSIWFLHYDGVSRYIPDTATDIDESIADSSPAPLAITGNNPNPFNPATSIGFTLPSGGRVELAIYAITGQKVATLADGFLPAGSHTVRWNGRGEDDAACSSGVYIAVLKAGGHTAAHRMLLVK